MAGKTTEDGTSLDGIYYIPQEPPSPSNSRVPSPMMNVLLKNKLQTTVVKDEERLSISDIIDLRSPAGDIINAIINSNEQNGINSTTLTIEGE